MSDVAGRLSDLESAYYPRWMAFTGAASNNSWSKRRAMFWGLLISDSVVDAYANGERIARTIGRPESEPWPRSLDIRAWFFRKAAIANLFEVAQTKLGYALRPRDGDPWAPLLHGLAEAIARGTDAGRLPDSLPARGDLDTNRVAVAHDAQRLFGSVAMEALGDVIADDAQDAKEFRFAVLRNSRDDALFWYEREWSFRAKEKFRTEVIRRQEARCACCDEAGLTLELNHIRKVRDFGPTRSGNLEGLCKPCHTSIDKHGMRCHSGRGG